MPSSSCPAGRAQGCNQECQLLVLHKNSPLENKGKSRTLGDQALSAWLPRGGSASISEHSRMSHSSQQIEARLSGAPSVAQEANLQPKVGTSQPSSPRPREVPATLPVLFLMFWDRWPQMAPPGDAGESAGRTLGKRLARPLNKEEAEEGGRCPQGASTPYAMLPGPGGAPTDLDEHLQSAVMPPQPLATRRQLADGSHSRALPSAGWPVTNGHPHPASSHSLAPKTTNAHAHLETGRQRPHKPRRGLCLWHPGVRHCILGDKWHFNGAWPSTGAGRGGGASSDVGAALPQDNTGDHP